MALKSVLISRVASSDQGTLGVLCVPAIQFVCYTLELPNRNNMRSISRIPAGTYKTILTQSPRHGFVYHVLSVPKRSAILLHAGNFAGDTSLGYLSDVEGCIILGERYGIMRKQRAVLVSKPAVRRFEAAMNSEPFMLTIQ